MVVLFREDRFTPEVSASYHHRRNPLNQSSEATTLTEITPKTPGETMQPPSRGDDTRQRRLVTDQWGMYAFWVSVSMLVLLSAVNLWIAPIFRRYLDMPPAPLRKQSSRIPWTNLAILIWCCALLVTCSIDLSGNLVWFAKRTGRVAVAAMPPMYFLTLKPSVLPRAFYLQLLPLHKWLSRFVVAVAVVHTVAYLYLYHERGILLIKIMEYPNICGIVALFLFLVMTLTSLTWFRRPLYRYFYALHFVGAWAVVFFLRKHSRPSADGYLFMCLAVLALQVIQRIRTSVSVKLRVQFASSTLLLVDIPKEQLPGFLWTWSPAAHVRLSGSLALPQTWLTSSHPYTIASLPDEPTLKLVIRKTRYPIKMRCQYSLNGPYRSLPMHLERQVQDKNVRRALLVIGGAGIAFGAPLFRWLQLHGIQLKLLWATRDPYDARALPALGLEPGVLHGDIEIYYSGASLSAGAAGDEELSIEVSNSCDKDGPSDDQRGQRKSLKKRFRGDESLTRYLPAMYNSRPHLNLRLRLWLYGLNMDSDDCCCADRLIDACEEDKLGVWVLASGAPRLVQDARAWANASGVNFFEENFSL